MTDLPSCIGTFIKRPQPWPSLAARCAWAMASVLAPLDPGLAGHLAEHAGWLAQNCGEDMGDRERVPPLLQVDALRECYLQGCSFAESREEFLAAYVQPLHCGEWHAMLDPGYEARVMVYPATSSTDPFEPCLEVSWQGGEPTVSYGTPQPSLAKAIEAGWQMRRNWECDENPSDEAG